VPDAADLLVFAYGNNCAGRRAVVDRLALALDASRSAASVATAPADIPVPDGWKLVDTGTGRLEPDRSPPGTTWKILPGRQTRRTAAAGVLSRFGDMVAG
jgi:hypothetical protein